MTGSSPISVGEHLARLTGGQMMRLEGVGHCPPARKPVLVNIAVREFVDALAQTSTKEVSHGYG